VPLFIDSEILYSNRKLLDKYDEKPPETWDELIRIASKIKKK
jgi:trehalose/maltose transport system substrate-binding protein